MVFFGGMPMGSLVVGWLAARVGEPGTVLGGATLLGLSALWMWVRMPSMPRLK